MSPGRKVEKQSACGKQGALTEEFGEFRGKGGETKMAEGEERQSESTEERGGR